MKSVLIANRGEIAVRICKTLRLMGLTSVAVYTSMDEDAPHVKAADRAILLDGEDPLADGYLNAEKLVALALANGVDAIHPGYGFLSEDPGFASLCEQNNIAFIGPRAEVNSLMGSKSKAREFAEQAGVRCIPGYQGPDQSPARMAREAEKIGYPVMLKAVAGGGGRGLRLVLEPSQLLESLQRVQSEARLFADPGIMIEKAMQAVRHVEVQVLGDKHGAVAILGDRDCSVQRRHQKIVEEAPAPGLSPAVRKNLWDSARALACACNYLGAGTVEFLLDEQGQHYFLEMNTRLQVEHPVTEMVFDIDLVQCQIRVENGESLEQILPSRLLDQTESVPSGHCIEVRLNCEDPLNAFLPQTGTILTWQQPEGPGIRLDLGFTQGMKVGRSFDPMIGKLIVWGKDREEARRRMSQALSRTRLVGVLNNLSYLKQVIDSPLFDEGALSTEILSALTVERPSAFQFEKAAIALLLEQHQSFPFPQELWGFNNTGVSRCRFQLAYGEEVRDLDLSIEPHHDAYKINVRAADKQTTIYISPQDPDCFQWRMEGRPVERIHWIRDGATIWISDEQGTFAFVNQTYRFVDKNKPEGSGTLFAPFAGRVVELKVQEGDFVLEGATIMVLEAMKMEHQLRAERDGKVSRLLVDRQSQVMAKQALAEISSDIPS
ncbi:acetyl/propionyl/methylcrotonyl-CoA carboxylase subunit alpha [Oligoflexus tunisiensis]|uniref:acetyl/propionyl/methylcrotonyl-CoA carboxylase subunit alpha n=1 Tax=Oligoflexus tunisiensis TaxID=708132 RepID=UPI000AF1AFE7|nr:biotin carboxylase N-terminal domain-containing protein [Oligoflexus tunisiensis]